MLIFPTALNMASNKDFPGPAYYHKKCYWRRYYDIKVQSKRIWKIISLTFQRPIVAIFASVHLQHISTNYEPEKQHVK